MTLDLWARRHGIPVAAITELRSLLGAGSEPIVTSLPAGASETAAQTAVRIEASRRGARLWRNNVGAGALDNGQFIRWGLANESKAMNQAVKSADLIGVLPVLITPEHVGTTIGQFWSVEMKRPGWRYTGTGREAAQMKWAEIVTSLGGRAEFSTGG